MQTIAEAITVILTLGLMISLVCLCPIWAPDWLYRGLDVDADIRPQSVPLFTVADLFLVTLQLAIANALVLLVREGMPEGSQRFLQIVANFFVAINWLRCLIFMRNRNVGRPIRRILVQMIFYPLAVVLVGQLLASFFVCLSVTDLNNLWILMVDLPAACLAFAATRILRKLFARFICGP